MKREDRLRLAARLRTVDHPEARAVAEELEADARPPGRPPEQPRARLLRRAKRVLVAEAIYQGVFPLHLAPPSDHEIIRRAKGSRELADARAAALINASPATVRNARRARGPMDASAWEELRELLLIRAGR